jgi:hypothetical protein
MAEFTDLMDMVIDQIVEDIDRGDLTAIVELLSNISEENLRAFLSEVTNG